MEKDDSDSSFPLLCSYLYYSSKPKWQKLEIVFFFFLDLGFFHSEIVKVNSKLILRLQKPRVTSVIYNPKYMWHKIVHRKWLMNALDLDLTLACHHLVLTSYIQCCQASKNFEHFFLWIVYSVGTRVYILRGVLFLPSSTCRRWSMNRCFL